VSRAAVVVVLGVLGCGRVGFDRAPPPGDAADTPPIDAPPVPAAICKVDRVAQSGLPATADLAITGTAEGYAALWVDTASAAAAHGVVLGPNHQVLHAATLPGITDIALGGLADAGQKLVLASSNGRDATLWVIDRDVAAATAQTTLASRLLGRDPYPSDAGQRDRAFVTARDDKIEISLVASDGLVNTGASSQFAATAQITDLACTDGPDHSHCVWVNDFGAGSQCVITDVLYMGSLAPVIGSHDVMAMNCRDVRNASGPVPADSMIVVWVDEAGGITARYSASSGDVERAIASTGSAPKVRFDGTRFWIAWLDATGELRLSSFELNGTIVPYELPGWTPIGPEAFELVTRGNETGLSLLSAAGLEFLTICS
jgi:hypothetical protein